MNFFTTGKQKVARPGKFRIFNFTLTEVTLAMAVITVGMVGILALFPVGFKATKDAIGDNYSSEMADQFLHLLKMQCVKYNGDGQYTYYREGVAPSYARGSDLENGVGDGTQDWDGWGEWIDERTGVNAVFGRNYYDDRTINTLPETAPSADNLDIGKVMSSEEAKNTDIRLLQRGRFFGDSDGDDWDDLGIYYDVDREGVNNGVFYVEARSGDILDWDGVMYVWQERVEFDGNPIDKKYAARLCIEISWPFAKPYDKRRKRVYALEIYNPNDR